MLLTQPKAEQFDPQIQSQKANYIAGYWLSGAGKTTVLKTLEDMGWEAVDNFPIRLAGPLLDIPHAGRSFRPCDSVGSRF